MMDKKRLKELAGVVNETTELEKALQESKNPEVLEEAGMFGAAGYGGDKTPEQEVMSRLVHMLRDAKVFLRDGNIKDATMMIDRAYSTVAKSAAG